ncbi:MAG: alkaline phosphatase [Sphingobacteriales bacterium 17-39-43]|uniref:alkaline phosphatase n=1 Tax=Daejeonella sp. TaxID=2805397 RepID=UPI000BD4314C|nr:alkaline phosphatase [Daejeonella sp.]OYX97460.1 MAG: alkaline phosphatase [Sphingobacteriia bacterium 35-40-5]OYZ32474.1 MAG: alkaline phosphatase [Sphingobacteriales bacterium 16-39-50]OZA25837.1 MAG: alkaline phosphatase [Sphingobacteriales bacterium 17-39-43]HQT21967.1 alkaline phosphatase [Daejeonella sp.]HQT57274.1 alkaline phosphatase [Daejeonella sp.]
MKNELRKLIVLLFLFALTPAVVFSQKIKHVILIGSDGFGAYAFENAKVPNLRAMMKEGSWSLEARTVLPSSSAANWASMVMGAGPELHGYTTWGSKKPDMPARVLDEYGMFPSVYALLRKEKPDSEIGVIYEWDGIGYLFPKAAVNHDQNANGDIAIANAASKYIIEKKPNFLFVHLHDVDSVGHNVGHGTPDYYAAIERTDTHIGTILKSIKEAGIEKNTVVLFTADHGGVNKGHGLISMNEMQIPWIIRGSGIQRNKELTESIMTFDTAATIAKLLKLKVPQVWIGRPVKGAFNK